jgi:hypothetical protein
MAEEQQNPFDSEFQHDGNSYRFRTVPARPPHLPTPSVLVTDVNANLQYLLAQTEAEPDTGEITNANIRLVRDDRTTVLERQPDIFPAPVRAALADAYQEALGNAAVPVAEEVLQNLREGKASLKAPPREEREVNGRFNRMMNGTDLDAEAARTIAENRMDTLLDALNTAKESGDEKAVARATEQLKTAHAEQGQMEEAADMLAKPKNHFAREDFEAKHAGDAVEGQMQEDGHVAKLKAQRAAEQEKGAEGQAR